MMYYNKYVGVNNIFFVLCYDALKCLFFVVVFFTEMSSTKNANLNTLHL